MVDISSLWTDITLGRGVLSLRSPRGLALLAGGSLWCGGRAFASFVVVSTGGFIIIFAKLSDLLDQLTPLVLGDFLVLVVVEFGDLLPVDLAKNLVSKCGG